MACLNDFANIIFVWMFDLNVLNTSTLKRFVGTMAYPVLHGMRHTGEFEVDELDTLA